MTKDITMDKPFLRSHNEIRIDIVPLRCECVANGSKASQLKILSLGTHARPDFILSTRSKLRLLPGREFTFHRGYINFLAYFTLLAPTKGAYVHQCFLHCMDNRSYTGMQVNDTKLKKQNN